MTVVLFGIRDTEITRENTGNPLDVLRYQRLIQTELVTNLVHFADGRGRTGNLAGGVTGDKVDEQEDDDGDNE